jgi:choline kinase
MKALILSAGQGSRLLPLTEDCPKCLLPIDSRRMIELQIEHLAACGIDDVAVVVGFRAGAVEAFLEPLNRPGLKLRSIFNPFFNVADNLGSCWMARSEMDRDFVLLNGDTLFEPAVLDSLLGAPQAPVTLAIDRKDEYDSDDMKVRLAGTRLIEVGKTRRFAEVLDEIMRTPNGISWWYLKAIGVLADQGLVETHSIEGLTWGEVDFKEDLDRARELFPQREPSTITVAESGG